MKWVHLLISMLLFPISLVWYRRDLARGISPRVYWATMALWIIVNVALTAWAFQGIEAQLRELSLD